ncbi:uncharacterized protein MEPE_00673 [Melanopsichium pennsylvanicum]|uniref:Uncharacterized protein n=2 Tax=Melanopsichium pennsylvanicum TaxID=63383 RepID=A0AAJ4XIX2_9BASI|nr:hypothetical protein BN887_03861 [Melanopsichium pennsylvanicum 4]SNX81968.1 uncharacterized protein MEPE_00673 [Melanopsichium pennsylvanicum]
MVTRIPNEAGPSHPPSNYLDLSPRRSLNPACRDVQATLSSFRISGHSTAESSSTGNAPTTFNLHCSSDDDYIEPSCMLDAGSRRPSVQRTSSAPEPSSSTATLFVNPFGPPSMRPSPARACSESRASGVLERRRRKVASGSDSLPSDLMLDLANLPMTMGAGNLGLLRAARRAIAEPCGFDWGRVATSAPPSATNSRFLTQQQQRPSISSPARSTAASIKILTTVSLPASTSVSTSTSPASARIAGVGSCWSNRAPDSDESEWDWALAGNARATYEALRFSTYKETKEPVHDIWQQLPDWVSRRSSLGGRDADFSLRGPGLHNSLALSKTGKDQATANAATAAAALSLSLSQATLSNSSPRNSISGRGRGHPSTMSVHVPFRVIEEVAPHEGSISPRASFVGARDHASDSHRSRSVRRGEATVS